MSDDHWESIFQTASDRSWLWVRNPWRRLKIIHRVAAAIGDNLWDRDFCWGKSGIILVYDDQGARKLMEIVVAPMSIEDIWSGIGLVGTDHSSGSGAAATVKYFWPGINAWWIYLAQYIHLLEKFGWGPCIFRIFGQDWRYVRTSIPQSRSREGLRPCYYIGD